MDFICDIFGDMLTLGILGAGGLIILLVVVRAVRSIAEACERPRVVETPETTKPRKVWGEATQTYEGD